MFSKKEGVFQDVALSIEVPNKASLSCQAWRQKRVELKIRMLSYHLFHSYVLSMQEQNRFFVSKEFIGESKAKSRTEEPNHLQTCIPNE